MTLKAVLQNPVITLCNLYFSGMLKRSLGLQYWQGWTEGAQSCQALGLLSVLKDGITGRGSGFGLGFVIPFSSRSWSGCFPSTYPGADTFCPLPFGLKQGLAGPGSASLQGGHGFSWTAVWLFKDMCHCPTCVLHRLGKV